jgi:hypothetical protein
MLIIVLPMAIWLYGRAGGFGAWGRSLAGRLILGALSGPALASLIGAIIGAFAQDDPWMPAHQKVGLWEAVFVYSLT